MVLHFKNYRYKENSIPFRLLKVSKFTAYSKYLIADFFQVTSLETCH